MATCQISSLFTTAAMAGGLGLWVLGLITIGTLLRTERGERMELEPTG